MIVLLFAKLRTEFAVDSPLEGTGFELLVPLQGICLIACNRPARAAS